MMPFSWMYVEWLHDNNEYPVHFYSEMDDDRYETRKVEIYRDGRTDVASATLRTGDTELGDVAVPSLKEIVEDPQFLPVEITKEQFEEVWKNSLPGV